MTKKSSTCTNYSIKIPPHKTFYFPWRENTTKQKYVCLILLHSKIWHTNLLNISQTISIVCSITPFSNFTDNLIPGLYAPGLHVLQQTLILLHRLIFQKPTLGTLEQMTQFNHTKQQRHILSFLKKCQELFLKALAFIIYSTFPHLKCQSTMIYKIFLKHKKA